jgi:predicted RNase H-like nuclease
VSKAGERYVHTKFYERFTDIHADFASADRILVDMPIGLSENERRTCDEAASRFLGSRASTIFFAPARETLEIEEYRVASEKNKELTGYGLSKQSWHIVSHIRQLNAVMTDNPEAPYYVLESHPEVCFAAFKGEVIAYSKKTEEGLEERLEVLRYWYPHADEVVNTALAEHSRSYMGHDDILDALVLALAAEYSLTYLPADTAMPKDTKGLPMVIHYPDL